MKEFVEIEGYLIDKASITSITNIEENSASCLFTFFPSAYLSFKVKYIPNSYITIYSDTYRMNFFNGKPKSHIEKEFELKQITKKRDEIKQLLNID